MNKQHNRPCHQHKRRFFWLTGLGSLIWLLYRSGVKPHRLAYPCQQVALANSLGLIGYLLSLLGVAHLYRRLKQHGSLPGLALFIFLLFIAAGLLTASAVPTGLVRAADLPAWVSASAISDIFVVQNVPEPRCSLDGGALPATGDCSNPGYALSDIGVNSLINRMESQGDYFYKTAAHPAGVVGSGDVVVIKINNQWAGQGDGSGSGRLTTNSDVLKGLIWDILQHPDGFSGEIVVAENTQGVVDNWNITPANAQDQNQTYQDVVNVFQLLGHPVSLYRWDDLNESRVSGGNVASGGYPGGEYATGNTNDAYILLEDAAGSGVNELSYPKFQTANGAYVSMRYGVWNGASYNSDRLTFINLPVLKRHGMAGATSAWKNLIGFLTIANDIGRFGDWDSMHGFFWGYQGLADTNYGLIGRQIALIRAPDLNIVDAIWVGYEDNTNGQAARQNILLASVDPFALDWYASEYILRPLATWDAAMTSAARAGEFRNATRVNQNSAAAAWPGGSYPYIDLLDSYDGDTPDDAEKNQMNVYLADASGATIPTLRLTTPDGGEHWPVNTDQQIRWTTTGTVTQVNLYYAIDSVTSTIELNIANSGVYTWLTPVTPTALARVRVESVVSPTTVYAVSRATFVLCEPADCAWLTYLPLLLKE